MRLYASWRLGKFSSKIIAHTLDTLELVGRREECHDPELVPRQHASVFRINHREELALEAFRPVEVLEAAEELEVRHMARAVLVE